MLASGWGGAQSTSPLLQTWPLHSKFYTSSLLSKSLTEMLQDECCAMGEALLTALMLLGLRWAPNDVILTYPEKWEGFWGPVYVLTQPYLSTKLEEFVSILAKGINSVLLFPFFPSFISFEFIPMYTGGCVNISRGANLWNLFQCLLKKDLWNNQSSRTSFTHAWTCFLFSE